MGVCPQLLESLMQASLEMPVVVDISQQQRWYQDIFMDRDLEKRLAALRPSADSMPMLLNFQDMGEEMEISSDESLQLDCIRESWLCLLLPTSSPAELMPPQKCALFNAKQLHQADTADESRAGSTTGPLQVGPLGSYRAQMCVCVCTVSPFR